MSNGVVHLDAADTAYPEDIFNKAIDKASSVINPMVIDIIKKIYANSAPYITNEITERKQRHTGILELIRFNVTLEYVVRLIILDIIREDNEVKTLNRTLSNSLCGSLLNEIESKLFTIEANLLLV